MSVSEKQTAEPAHQAAPVVSKHPTKKRKAKPASVRQARQKTAAVSRPGSKQDRVVGMLSRAQGATVAAIMKATDWQKHSVHGFFAGVVRKKLKLNLVSEGDNGKRTYRIVKGGSPKGTRKTSGKRAR